MSEEEKAAFKKLIEEQKTNIKKRKIAINSLIIFGAVLAIIIAIVLVVWFKKDPLEKLVSFDKTADATDMLSILCGTSVALWFALDEMKDVIFTCLGSNILKRENADFKGYAKETNGTLNEYDLDALSYYLLAQYWSEKPQDRKLEIAKCVISAVDDFSAFVILGPVIASVIKNSMLENKFAFDLAILKPYLGVLIAAFIFWVISAIIKIVYAATVKKRVKAWSNEVFGN